MWSTGTNMISIVCVLHMLLAAFLLFSWSSLVTCLLPECIQETRSHLSRHTELSALCDGCLYKHTSTLWLSAGRHQQRQRAQVSSGESARGVQRPKSNRKESVWLDWGRRWSNINTYDCIWDVSNGELKEVQRSSNIDSVPTIKWNYEPSGRSKIHSSSC